MPSVPWRVESSKIFLKIKKILKIPKMPKSVPKSIQTCFSVIFSKKIYAQCSMEGRVFENFQQKNIFKIPKMPKSVPKSLQTCFEQVFGANFSKNFCPVFHGMSSLRKISKTYIFKITKMPKTVPKSIQTCFRVIFSKKFYARCSMEDRVFKNFQFFFFKIPKMPKIVPKTYPNMF